MPSSRRPKPGGRPGSSRPGRRGGTARPQAEQARPARARLTNRAAILAVVFAVLVVSYASSMRAFLQQREHIASLEAKIAASKKSIAEAEREKRRWKDPAYVEAQARSRFGWVLPGETSYQVLDADGTPLTGADELTDPATVAPDAPVAWWSKVGASLDAADHPEKQVKPTPVDRIKPTQ